MELALNDMTREFFNDLPAGELSDLICSMTSYLIELSQEKHSLEIELKFLQEEHQRETFKKDQEREQQESIDRISETRFI